MGLPEELAWAKMVLLLKGKGGYQGIRMVEVVSKLCAAVLNLRLNMVMELHYSLHGFWEGRGTGTADLEANLYQQMAGLSQEPFFRFSWMCGKRMLRWTGVDF